MRKIFIAFLLTGSFYSLTAQTKLIIKGTVKGDTKGYNKVYVYGDSIQQDSVMIENGAFTFSLPWENGMVPVLYNEYEMKEKGGISPYAIVVDKAGTVFLKDIDITKGLRTGKISGSPSAIAFQSFDKGNEKLEKEIDSTLSARFPGKDYRDTSYRKAYDELMAQKMVPYIRSFVKSNSGSFAGTYVLLRNRYLLKDQDMENLYGKLSPAQQATKAGKKMADYLKGLKASAVGRQVNNFTLSTPADESFSLSSLKGKYIMLDFWASWCGPCKAAFPHMKEVYQKYRGDQFEILGISIDKDKAAWLKELGIQQLPWLQVLDTKSISISGFAVTAVPTAYLISPEGKIIMKEIGFDSNGNGEIEKKLKELFDK